MSFSGSSSGPDSSMSAGSGGLLAETQEASAGAQLEIQTEPGFDPLRRGSYAEARNRINVFTPAAGWDVVEDNLFNPAASLDETRLSEKLLIWTGHVLEEYGLDVNRDVHSSTSDSGSDVKRCLSKLIASAIWDWCIPHLLNVALVEGCGSCLDPTASSNRACRNLISLLIWTSGPVVGLARRCQQGEEGRARDGHAVEDARESKVCLRAEMETPLGSEADDGGEETQPRVQKVGQKKDVKNFLDAQLRMRPRDGSGDSRARRQFDDIMIADAIAFAHRMFPDRRASKLEIKRIQNPDDPSLQPIPASKVTKKRALQLSSEEARERIAQREEAEAAEREEVEVRHDLIFEHARTAIEDAEPFSKAECDDAELAQECLAALDRVRVRCSQEQGQAIHETAVSLETAIKQLLKVFNGTAWAKARKEAAAFAPAQYQSVLRSGGQEPMISLPFVGDSDREVRPRCGRSTPENLAGGARGAFNSLMVHAQSLERVNHSIISRGDVFLSRLASSSVVAEAQQGGEVAESLQGKMEEVWGEAKRRSEEVLQGKFAELEELLRDHHSDGSRLAGLDIRANASFGNELCALFKAAHGAEPAWQGSR
ncbi:hypothetical protein B484DRAFT_400696 [Ochromonadaceae sp. CCMP2298]|nr:hypothetical protein B484DRAFT_400696 [Ochromonadaceae sp. CCMP2298]